MHSYELGSDWVISEHASDRMAQCSHYGKKTNCIGIVCWLSISYKAPFHTILFPRTTLRELEKIFHFRGHTVYYLFWFGFSVWWEIPFTHYCHEFFCDEWVSMRALPLAAILGLWPASHPKKPIWQPQTPLCKTPFDSPKPTLMKKLPFSPSKKTPKDDPTPTIKSDPFHKRLHDMIWTEPTNDASIFFLVGSPVRHNVINNINNNNNNMWTAAPLPPPHATHF